MMIKRIHCYHLILMVFLLSCSSNQKKTTSGEESEDALISTQGDDVNNEGTDNKLPALPTAECQNLSESSRYQEQREQGNYWYQISRCFMGKGQYALAKLYALRGLEENKNDTIGLLLVTYSYYKLGQMEEVGIYLNQMAPKLKNKKDPGLSIFYLKLMIDSGLHEKASDYLKSLGETVNQLSGVSLSSSELKIIQLWFNIKVLLRGSRKLDPSSLEKYQKELENALDQYDQFYKNHLNQYSKKIVLFKKYLRQLVAGDVEDLDSTLGRESAMLNLLLL